MKGFQSKDSIEGNPTIDALIEIDGLIAKLIQESKNVKSVTLTVEVNRKKNTKDKENKNVKSRLSNSLQRQR